MFARLLTDASTSERPRRVGAVPFSSPCLSARLAQTGADRAAAFALRHRVFVGGRGAGAPDVADLETDRYDALADHLILEDSRRAPGDRVIGVSRLISAETARAAGGFYTADEFDIAVLLNSGHSLLELGRTCLHSDYRGSAAMVVLWQALGRIVAARGVTLLFGAASLPGTDISCHAEALRWLQSRYLAPEALRVRSRQGGFADSDATGGTALGEAPGDRVAAMRGVPSLIKSYLRLGGVIGDGVFIDHVFKTTDVCMMLDVTRLKSGQARLYVPASGD